jgi:short-subunit dehydrogenase
MGDPVKTAVVTGASGGIGRSIAEALFRKGYHVIGTSRRPENIAPPCSVPGVDYRTLDLTDGESIDGFIKSLDRVDILVNNAGASQIGPVEDVSLPQVRALFELVFFGQVRMIQGVLPLMRASGGGRIINITSFAGHTPVPFAAFYAAGKAALETLTLGLRSEVRRYGIHVTAVAPTFVRTGIYQESIIRDDSAYRQEFGRVKAIRDAGIANGCDPSVIAAKVMQVLEYKHPAAFYAAGRNAAVMAFLHRLCPSGLREKAVRVRFKLE